MRRAIGWLVLVIAIAIAAVIANLLIHGVSTRDEPTHAEAILARTLRHFAVPMKLRSQTNPVPLTPAALHEGRAHFADHCAQCHGNDGKGETEMGRRLYPRAPDMTLPETQKLSDGELFAIIRNGIRLTGMPAWGAGEGDDADNWKLVHFIRHLPKMTKEEAEAMRALNPVSPAELREQQEEREFLNGGESHHP